jgi:hypothetical protein
MISDVFLPFPVLFIQEFYLIGYSHFHLYRTKDFGYYTDII